MEQSEIKQKLEELNRNYPEKWYHNYHFGHGIYSIPDQSKNDNFLIRSDIVMELVYFFLRASSPEEIRMRSLRLLDLACAEGLQSIEAALHGFEVVGLEGRKPFIERAEFAKNVFNLQNVQFREQDVRNISAGMFGVFDVTLALGILYHLDKDSLAPFCNRISEMTKTVLILDTHISNDVSVKRYKLGEEGVIGGRYRGRHFREHPKGLLQSEKLLRVRASLDNDESFWLEYDSLCDLLRDHGFSYVFDVKRPEYNTNKELLRTRVLVVALRDSMYPIFPKSYISEKSIT
jgi:2-polyprenyl-3-methyl-5-hydroxy-6-metoxy-1,4-benzoquinol methylase